MPSATPMAERQALVLAELTELGLELARKAHARGLAAETAQEERAAVLVFHRISRSIRQTLALEAQLERLRARTLREAVELAEARTQKAVEKRKAFVKSVVERLVWREYEPTGEAGWQLVEHLDDLIAEDSLADDFLAADVEAQIERLRIDLKLAADEPASATSAHPGDPEGAARSRQGGETSAHPGESRDPSGASIAPAAPEPASAWIPAFAGTSGEGDATPPPPESRWAGTWPDSS